VSSTINHHSFSPLSGKGSFLHPFQFAVQCWDYTSCWRKH